MRDPLARHEPHPTNPSQGSYRPSPGSSEAPFQAAGTGDVRCLTCGEQISTSSPFADRIRRVDGASVPRDLATVTEVHCPICGAMGSIVLDDGVTEAVLVVDLRREPRP